ncbi:protein kinase [Planctomycetota bacterium]
MAEKAENNQDAVLDKAVEQFLAARLRGEELYLEQFVRQHPGLEKQIRQKVENCQRVSSLFDSLREVDESEFQHAEDETDLIGKKLGHFEIREMIGRGGMGVVYLAGDTRLDRSVAIKSIPPGLMDNATARKRFTREAKLLASLSHPNIAVIHEIIEKEEGANYLVLEYVPGQTLAERITEGPLKLQDALTIALQIAEAVAAAHDHDVIHRDLKPGNIMITPDGRVKVLDFGLAKASVSKDKNVENTVTQPGRVIGTPAYMSPEQACGKDTDHRTDIWSFGCIMYEMLTGHLPFEGETATDTLARIIERQPDWDVLPQETPTNIRTLLRRCLEKKPQRRLRDIGDASIEINETLNMPLTAPPVTTPSSTSLKPQITTRHKLRTAAIIVAAAFMIVLAVIAVQFVSKKEVQPSLKEIRLVVLPFENLGSTEDEYFAAGMTDAITARLAVIHGLGVISRQSAIQYKKREKDTRQIAKELRVDYILEGTVQRERPSDPKSRVRIIPQLINASDNTNVWAQTYDNDMSEVFQVQSDLAERVAQALDITLLEQERKELQARPTQNIEAYECYLRGNEYRWTGAFHKKNLRIAIQMYEKAVELDPTFALAYAQLSRAHLSTYWRYYDRSEEREGRLARAKEAVDKALQLNPNLAEVRMALGHYYYQGLLDYDRALEQFAIARKSQPNSSDILSWIGYVQRRQGNFEQALANIKKASELDPLRGFGLGETYMLLGMYPEAEQSLERTLLLHPDDTGGYNNKAWLYVRWQGSTEKARAVLVEALQNIRLEESTPIVDSLVTLDIFDGNYQEALDRLSLTSEDIDNQDNFIPTALRSAQIYGYMDQKELAKKYYDESRSILESKIQQRPEDAWFHSSLGIAYAGLGRKQDAIREGKRAVDLLPVTKEALRGRARVEDLARIYVMVGEFDEAIDQLNFLLSRPGVLSIPLLRLDPTWDPLRNHPRFKKLIESDN